LVLPLKLGLVLVIFKGTMKGQRNINAFSPTHEERKEREVNKNIFHPRYASDIQRKPRATLQTTMASSENWVKNDVVCTRVRV